MTRTDFGEHHWFVSSVFSMLFGASIYLPMDDTHAHT